MATPWRKCFSIHHQPLTVSPLQGEWGLTSSLSFHSRGLIRPILHRSCSGSHSCWGSKIQQPWYAQKSTFHATTKSPWSYQEAITTPPPRHHHLRWLLHSFRLPWCSLSFEGGDTDIPLETGHWALFNGQSSHEHVRRANLDASWHFYWFQRNKTHFK